MKPLGINSRAPIPARYGFPKEHNSRQKVTRGYQISKKRIYTRKTGNVVSCSSIFEIRNELLPSRLLKSEKNLNPDGCMFRREGLRYEALPAFALLAWDSEYYAHYGSSPFSFSFLSLKGEHGMRGDYHCPTLIPSSPPQRLTP